MSAQVKAVVAYWIGAAREQNRWRVALRKDARKERRLRVSGRLYDEARRCRDRRDCFMVEARRLRALHSCTQA